jgi:hypothetical protein
MARVSRLAVLCFALSFGCPAEGPKAPPYPAPKVETGGKRIAKIGNVEITTQEIEKRIRQQSPFVRVQLKDPKKLELFVREQIRNEVVAQEAWQQKLYDDPAVQAEFRRVLIQKVMKDRLAATKDDTTSETELLSAYKERTDEFNKPETIRLSQIVRYTDDDKERKEAHKILEKVMKEVVDRQKKNDQSAFGEAARQWSEDENTKNGGGDLQFMNQAQLTERYGPEVAAHVFTAVDIGDMAIADAPNAVVLFKKTGKRRAVERTLEQVKPQLRGAILGEKRTKAFETFVADLEKKHGVTVDTAAISAITVDMNAPTEPGGEKEE